MLGQYFKFHNPATGESKEFFRKKGITLQLMHQLQQAGFQLVEKIIIKA